MRWMDSTTRAASLPSTSLRRLHQGKRRGSPAQLAAQARFAAEWGGRDGLIATKATPERAA